MELLTFRTFASLKWAGTVQLPKLIVSAPSWITDSFVLGATFLLSSYFATTFGWWVEVVRDLQRKELVKRLTFFLKVIGAKMKRKKIGFQRNLNVVRL